MAEAQPDVSGALSIVVDVLSDAINEGEIVGYEDTAVDPDRAGFRQRRNRQVLPDEARPNVVFAFEFLVDAPSDEASLRALLAAGHVVNDFLNCPKGKRLVVRSAVPFASSYEDLPR